MKRAIASLVVGLTGIGLFAYGLHQTLQIGTCASGNSPYLIARACPSGTGSKVVLLAVGIMLATAGMVIGMGRSSLFLWSALFLAGGIAGLMYSLGSGSSGTAKLAGYIIGATFILMGGPPMLYLLGRWAGALRAKEVRSRSKEADATVARVEQLQQFGIGQLQVRVTSAVTPLDEPSFEVSSERYVLSSQMPVVGGRVRVRYDSTDHDHFELVAGADASAEAEASIAAAARAIPQG